MKKLFIILVFLSLLVIPYLFFPLWIMVQSQKVKNNVNLYFGANTDSEIIFTFEKNEIIKDIFWISDRQFKYKDRFYILDGLKYQGNKIIYYSKIDVNNYDFFRIVKNIFSNKENNIFNIQTLKQILNLLFNTIFLQENISKPILNAKILKNEFSSHIFKYTVYINKLTPPPKSNNLIFI